MRVFIATGLILTAVTSTAIGQIPPGDDSGAAGVAVQSHVPATLEYLNELVAEVDFQNAELDQVMDWIDSLTPMSVVVRWQVLEDAGIERDKPVTMQVRNLRLSQVLWLIMNEAGGSDVKLAYRASGKLLIVSTAEDLGRVMVLRVYDVSDLLVTIPRFGGPGIDFATLSEGGGFGSLGRGGRPEAEETRSIQDRDADIQELIDLIVETVEPDSWAANGGLGTIRAFHEMLVVRNSLRVHQALGGYLAEGD
jgi:hypothetical protein